jgi:phosphatidate cytidylyltransferase
MLRQRVITATVLALVLLVVLFLLPAWCWGVLVTSVLLTAGNEWGRLAGYSGTGRALFCAALAAACAAIYWWGQGPDPARAFIQSLPGTLMYGVAAAFWLVVAPVWLVQRWRVRDRLLMAAVGCIVLLPFWHALVYLAPTPGRLLAAMGAVWLADTAGYFVGRGFGRRKLAVDISPGKTWEGAWGAFAVAPLYWIAASMLLPELMAHRLSALVWIALMTLLSIVGDLFESWMKRGVGVKDSGRLLPGHGGMLDRVDSLTATLPFAALYFAYLVNGMR